jgi:hypothetical protein
MLRKLKKAFSPKTTKMSPSRRRAIMVTIFIFVFPFYVDLHHESACRRITRRQLPAHPGNRNNLPLPKAPG